MQDPSTIKEILMHYKAPRWDEFPHIELYMDQMIELLSRWLEPLSFDQNRPSITSSMINNYVKNSIVEPPRKKKYTAYHLAYLYVVMVLKQCFTLQEISTLIMIYSSTTSSTRTADHFDQFARVFETLLHQVMETGNPSEAFFEDPTWQQTLMVDVIRAVCCRLYGVFQIYTFHYDKQSEPAHPKK